ncbi:MAG TPA: 3'(2'),5'-bisphosphate nucleotidase CysQ, partial [Rhodospirillaceae bacterium]|nr:3'(2'),5'-bisphosphate nucleotidase CysQ [Rhodospirillaceae bacterium]
GHAIVYAAGGSVTTSTGQPLLYGKEGFLNSDFVVRSRR